MTTHIKPSTETTTCRSTGNTIFSFDERARLAKSLDLCFQRLTTMNPALREESYPILTLIVSHKRESIYPINGNRNGDCLSEDRGIISNSLRFNGVLKALKALRVSAAAHRPDYLGIPAFDC